MYSGENPHWGKPEHSTDWRRCGVLGCARLCTVATPLVERVCVLLVSYWQLSTRTLLPTLVAHTPGIMCPRSSRGVRLPTPGQLSVRDGSGRKTPGDAPCTYPGRRPGRLSTLRFRTDVARGKQVKFKEVRHKMLAPRGIEPLTLFQPVYPAAN
jgi:hypothetical protein